MPPLDPIVAATDLSAPAQHAIERAALVSLETAMPLHLLHVANLAPLERLRQIMAATSDDMQQQVLDAARTRLDAFGDHDAVLSIPDWVNLFPFSLHRAMPCVFFPLFCLRWLPVVRPWR